MQSSSIQMLPDLTLAISKVLALFNEWLCMGEKKNPNRTEFGRNCSYFLFLLSLQAKLEYSNLLCSCLEDSFSSSLTTTPGYLMK